MSRDASDTNRKCHNAARQQHINHRVWDSRNWTDWASQLWVFLHLNSDFLFTYALQLQDHRGPVAWLQKSRYGNGLKEKIVLFTSIFDGEQDGGLNGKVVAHQYTGICCINSIAFIQFDKYH